jgi:hypothetical protein
MSMKFAVMQPYFLPYIGYFQLMDMVDTFVLYDNVEYTKKGWINRNRFLLNGRPQYFSVNLEKASDFATIRERRISSVFTQERIKILNRMQNAYRRAPYFEQTYPLLTDCLMCAEISLFDFIMSSVRRVARHLDIDTEIVVSSTLPIDHNLKNKYKLWALSRHLGIKKYVNPIGGAKLYDKDEFSAEGVDLVFHQSQLPEYEQGKPVGEFEPALSVVDVLMFNGRDRTKEQLKQFTLV